MFIMSILMGSKFNILIMVVVVRMGVVQGRCRNNTELVKYDLQEPVRILNYPTSPCWAVSPRTCCSPKNLDSLTKKVKKTIADITMVDVSASCKMMVSEVMCSACDADVGEGYVDGVCPSYCGNIYAACRNDYFIMDERNMKIRGCQNDDLVCWKLEQLFRILHHQDEGKAMCEMLDLEVNEGSCWHGVTSATKKGPSKKKMEYKKKQRRKEKSFWDGFEKESIYVGVIVFLVVVAAWKYFRTSNVRRGYYSLR